jgi:hypothetical protein
MVTGISNATLLPNISPNTRGETPQTALPKSIAQPPITRQSKASLPPPKVIPLFAPEHFQLCTAFDVRAAAGSHRGALAQMDFEAVASRSEES